MSIVLYGDPVLTTRATPVEHFDSELEDIARLIDVELKTCNGLAVAANQVGSPVALIGYKSIGDGDNYFMANMTVTFIDDKKWMMKEGCLSLPGMFWYIQRPRHVAATGFNLHGDKVSVLASDLKGRMFQHEADHLAGRLILDRITKRERRIALRELQQSQEAAAVSEIATMKALAK